GWPEVSLHAQVSAEGFYQKFGFEPVGERFEEAGIEHQAMRLALAGRPANVRPAAAARGPSTPLELIQGRDETVVACRKLVESARRELLIYTRDLEPAVYGQSLLVDALKQF